ncbi:metallophosphoesterase family protein [Patulibacter minatonensis]|uniref:metallophosphoesterase family protein n=1 Tax=Patulibacter minatonensis TaxID=298163 RepID=UPI0004BB5CAD|nr:metallophosphoesterase family protein [Patulibacter minatonensis]
MSAVPSSADGQVASPDARIAILSDTHFPQRGRTLCDAVVARLHDATAIIHAGDFCDGPALEELEAVGPPVHAVLGNNDAALRGRLPEQLTAVIAGVRIGVVHDAGPRSGRLRRLRRRFPDHDVVVFGHSHIPLHEEAEDGFQIVNPGSATDHRGRWPVHTMGELVVRDGVAAFGLLDLPD